MDPAPLPPSAASERRARGPRRRWLVPAVLAAVVAVGLPAYRLYARRALERERSWLRSADADRYIRPFARAGKAPAVLLVHGFGSLPYDFEPLRPGLDDAALAYEAILLDGHGDTGTRLDRVRFERWRAQVDDAFTRLHAEHGRVAVVGFSLGGALAVDLAARRPVERLVAVAPYFRISRRWSVLGSAEGWSVRAAPLLPRVVRLKAGTINDPDGLSRYRAHAVLAPVAVGEVARAGEAAAEAAARVRCPTLWVHAPGDTVADFRASQTAFASVPAVEKRFVAAERSNHVVLYDHDAGEVTAAIAAFLQPGG